MNPRGWFVREYVWNRFVFVGVCDFVRFSAGEGLLLRGSRFFPAWFATMRIPRQWVV